MKTRKNFRQFQASIFCIVCLFLTSISIEASTENSIFDLYPNPYQLLNYGFKNKVKLETKIEQSLINYQAFNCEGKNEKNGNLQFCEAQEFLQKLQSDRMKVQSLIEENSLIVGEDLYVLSSLLASNFELDFLLSEEQVTSHVSQIVSYIQARKRYAENLLKMSQNFFDIHPSSLAPGRSTVVPMYYALSNSASQLETLTRYLHVADCSEKQVLCNYYLSQLFNDYKKIKELYEKEILMTVRQMVTFVLSGNYGNLSLFEERVWLKDTQISLDQQNFNFFTDKMLTSAGHVDDNENEFKSKFVQIYQIEKTFALYFDEIQKKSLIWTKNSAKITYEINPSELNNIPYQKELLLQLVEEMNQHKAIVVDQIMQLDQEVLDVN